MSARTRLEENRAGFQRYKQDVHERGKPFYPYAMFHDTVMSLIVVSVIVGLAVVWKFTAGETPGDSGLLGPLYAEKADPGTISFVPRPDWYYYFLFYLLRIFKWPESVVLGTVGIPTIALLLLIALPFMDLRREKRILRRPVAVVAAILTVLSMAVLTWKGATAREALASEIRQDVPRWIAEENIDVTARQVPVEGVSPDQRVTLAKQGATLFSEAGCLTCHTYLGVGSSNLGAPDLTEEGKRNKGVEFQIDHLECPACVNPGSPMPSFQNLGKADLQKLAIFLEASKGKVK